MNNPQTSAHFPHVSDRFSNSADTLRNIAQDMLDYAKRQAHAFPERRHHPKTGGDNRTASIKHKIGNQRHMAATASMEEFEALLNESFEIDTPAEGSVVKGKVIAIEAGQAIIDVGYKMEGRIDLKEFAEPGEEPDIKVGDEVEVFLRQVENARGEAVISREKWPAAKKRGTVWKKPMLTKSVSMARSLAA